MDAYVELLKQTIELLYLVVAYKYCDTDGNAKLITKDEAVLGGNLTRLIKLNTSFLQNVCECKLEICYIINRCIAETYVNSKYMLVEGEERVKRNYIKYSLITEKELWETILSNVKERGDDTFPIEKRMQNSIQNSFDASDFDIEEVKTNSKWKSIRTRADAVAGEMFYSVFYGIASHSIHGNWQDILYNNLKKTDEGFKLELEWQRPKPQIMDGAITLNLDIVKIFSDKELGDHEHREILKEKCDTLLKYYCTLTEHHEKWMNKKNGL
jgi:Family of unknown function (DUF5677)